MEYTPISIKKVNKQSKGKTYEYFEARTTVTFEDGTKKRKCGTGKTRKDEKRRKRLFETKARGA